MNHNLPQSCDTLMHDLASFVNWVEELDRMPPHAVEAQVRRLMTLVRARDQDAARLDELLLAIPARISRTLFRCLRPEGANAGVLIQHRGCVVDDGAGDETSVAFVHPLPRGRKLPAKQLRSQLAMLKTDRLVSRQAKPRISRAASIGIPVRKIVNRYTRLSARSAEVRASPMIVTPAQRDRSRISCNVKLELKTDDPPRFRREATVKVILVSRGSGLRFPIQMFPARGSSFQGELNVQVGSKIRPMEIDRAHFEAIVVGRPLRITTHRELAESDLARVRSDSGASSRLRLARWK